MVSFVVYGQPATKGSCVSWMDKSGRIVTKTDSTGLGGWTQAVGWAARAAGVKLADRDVPVIVHAMFIFKKPTRPKDRKFPTVRPDADKTTRALLDALTSVAYHDDAQVVDLVITKRYGLGAETVITISEAQ